MEPDYGVRQARLDAAGFASYNQYLASPGWASHRRRIAERSGGRCEACGQRRGRNVHHFDYARLPDEALADLAHLCGDCHQQAHAGQHAAIWEAVQWTWACGLEETTANPLPALTVPLGKGVWPEPLWPQGRWFLEDCGAAFREVWQSIRLMGGALWAVTMVAYLAALVLVTGGAGVLLWAVLNALAEVPTLADLPGTSVRLVLWAMGLVALLWWLLTSLERNTLRLAMAFHQDH